MYAIVPAYNEEKSVAKVVGPLLSSGVFEDVIVVNDGSTDNTAFVAKQAGATVLQTPKNLRKGGAMRFAYRQLPGTEPVAFFDADLIGLKPKHVHQMAYAIFQGYDMVAGLRDKGSMQNFLQLFFSPLITGERILQRWVLDAIPEDGWSGYAIETAMNDVVERNGGRTCLIYLKGVSMRTKSQKTGYIKGIRDHWKMAKEISRTRRWLKWSQGRRCGGKVCDI